MGRRRCVYLWPADDGAAARSHALRQTAAARARLHFTRSSPTRKKEKENVNTVASALVSPARPKKRRARLHTFSHAGDTPTPSVRGPGGEGRERSRNRAGEVNLDTRHSRSFVFSSGSLFKAVRSRPLAFNSATPTDYCML